jgi:aminoglycoside phosphotransferase (APT) family kinase protein
MGVPAAGYPWHWSINRWLKGENATIERIADLCQFATVLAEFLMALQQIDSTDGPPPGGHNFCRGGPLRTYDAETRQAMADLGGTIDNDGVTSVWEAALNATWHGSPVWLHGDVSAGNLLVTRGQLSAVIDFGCLGVGDPSCDVTIAWTLFSGKSREALRAALAVDSGTWSRARGWALWKALITLAEDSGSLEAAKARHVLNEVLAEHEQL